MRHASVEFMLLVAVIMANWTPAFAAQRPNILFIMTDDQAAWALGASGNQQAITPHMDRLAREGARLTQAFATTPVCSPSRASLLSSRYGSELGITDWIHPSESIGIASELTTFAEILASAGYTTGLVGKWHLGHRHSRWHPTRHGYQHFMGLLQGGTTPSNPKLEKNGQEQQFTGLTADVLTDEALAFIQEHRAVPFMLSLHYRAPHQAWLPVAEEDWAPYAELDPEIPNPEYPDLNVQRVKRSMREYLASVRSVDRNLGRLLAQLEELKLDEKTVVIFTSDHGYNMGHNGIWHKGNGHWIVHNPPPARENIPRGQRPNMYDHSLRVPALVRWPGQVKPGSVINQTATHLDWYPTLVALAGASPPADETIRGRNLVPLLLGQNVTDWDNDLYAEYSTKHQSRTHMRAYRMPQWKLIRDFGNSGRDELYDLKNDPKETTNLIDDQRPEIQEVIATLHGKILDQMRKLNDPVLKEIER